MNTGDLNLDISYQDSQYLAELYRHLGSLQYNLENFDVVAHHEAMLCGVAVLLLGLLFTIAILPWMIDWDTRLITKIAIYIGFAIALIVIWYFVSDYMIYMKEHEIMRDIQATEMAIEGIKLKYGWI